MSGLERVADRLDTIHTFVRVVEIGSFSAAARELGIGQSAVSKQIAALETQLGAELMWRSSRTFSLTEAGRDFYEASIRLLEDFDAATSRVARGHAAPKGLVRVMASPTFSRLYVAPRMGEFLARYPEIAVELLISNTATNLIEDGIDVAMHSGDLSDSSLIVKRIAETSVATVATPTYLEKHGVPKHPSEFDQHRAVMFMHQGSPRESLFENKSGRIVHQPKGAFRTNDGEHVRIAMLAHLGIANAQPGFSRKKSIQAPFAGSCRSTNNRNPYSRSDPADGA
jgi:DNA-binding transcriptional LysR family regulator